MLQVPLNMCGFYDNIVSSSFSSIFTLHAFLSFVECPLTNSSIAQQMKNSEHNVQVAASCSNLLIFLRMMSSNRMSALEGQRS